MVTERTDEPDERIKIWNELLRRPVPIWVKAVTIISSPVFAPQRIELDRAVAFIGLHGTGKSFLLRTIEAVFGYASQAGSPPFIGEDGETIGGDSHPSEGVVDVEVQTSGGLLTHRIDFGSDAESRSKTWANELPPSYGPLYVSPGRALAELGMLFQDFSNIDKVKRSERRFNLNRSQVRAVNSILSKSYDRLTVDPDPFPGDEVAYTSYVTAHAHGKQIDSSEMSLGELWLYHVLYYALSVEAYPNDLVLLDEPESFLATRAQRPFIDEVARIALARNLQLIIGTHSPDILARFPLANIRMCVRSGDRTRVVVPHSISAIREAVGVEAAIRLVIFVEDEMAREIVRIIFSRYDPALIRESEIVAAGGEDMVIKTLRVLGGATRLKCAGILDADQRYSKKSSSDRIFFLPGSDSPEAELLSSIARKTEILARKLGRPPEDVETAVSLCEGSAHQYWLRIIAQYLGLTESELRYELVQIWLRDRRISRHAGRLTLDLRTLIS